MRLLLAGLVVLLLNACATAPDQPAPARPWQQRTVQLSALEHWGATGKLALRSGGQAESANLSWLQRGRHTRLQLSGPMGLRATEIHSDGQQLLIQRGDEQQQYDIASPGALREQTGWDLPVQALPYWLKGLPAPGGDDTRMRIEANLLRQLRQDGWTIDFERYQQFGAYILPTRLTAERGDTRARIVIQSWQPGEP
ncbi:lipoprotein insertase outer membrane protein LolB [Kineobactrum salinum]|uniref:Outer-membrane lipoprotein LolB n=1 Tax=Kineobactrum salinum TaxID=2708301 RepID=A0A6C0UA00_9GAMM|nr:lipoprotein insertase outer membrane protein LolB [Kineobactrum salinum]QIB66564.1 outer membrane lipoprotein LolB [Kineobactrum salinum]